VNTGKII
jgi:hypothetical protein